MPVKIKTLPQLVKDADKVFSRWVRDRDTVEGLYVEDQNGNSLPAGYCFTCYKIVPTQGKGTGEAGHFIKRGCKTLRYDETNVNLQCTRCNHFLSGNDGRYAVNLDKKYGRGTAAKLQSEEDKYKRDGYKFQRDELEEIIKYYGRKS